MNSLVVDASTILGVLLKDENSSYSEIVLGILEKRPAVHVPGLWWLETANGFLMAERRKRISRADASDALDFLRGLNVVTDEETVLRSSGETLALAREYTLTIYDAAYLELAIRRHVVLASIDKALMRAAGAAGVELVK